MDLIIIIFVRAVVSFLTFCLHMLLESFKPEFHNDARILVLGSMPGKVSLDAQRYYAHARNLFWPMLSDILGEALPLDYGNRLHWLKDHGIALWDVLKHCERDGSLDSRIDRRTEVPNDLKGLIAQLPQLQLVIFNGKKAEQLFRRHFSNIDFGGQLSMMGLPSTSPANAGMSYQEKVQAWREALTGRLN